MVAFVIALLGVTSGTAWAQGGTGTISGRVFDAESGAPIEGATVILAYPEQADGSDAPQQVVVTGIEGDYEFGAVPAGFYGLSFIKSGYRASNVTNVQVVSGRTPSRTSPAACPGARGRRRDGARGLHGRGLGRGRPDERPRAAARVGTRC
ncbi:MAG: carboxypeptidase-like regulatory domain-containing protein [Myxococcota bacterium]